LQLNISSIRGRSRLERDYYHSPTYFLIEKMFVCFRKNLGTDFFIIILDFSRSDVRDVEPLSTSL